ncbi:PEGA domain-containing protein [Candidatus Woesearchaeota archaeon]|nr:PEGA domain-containing protein [Candidatus Woesearchaeota archaeon]
MKFKLGLNWLTFFIVLALVLAINAYVGFIPTSDEIIIQDYQDITGYAVSLPQGFGKLTVTSTPTSANVFVQDTSNSAVVLSRTTPIINAVLPVGNYAVNISKTGYTGVVRPVVISGGRTTIVRVTLRQIPQPTLAITSTPSGASVTLNGPNGRVAFAGRAMTPIRNLRIQPGEYKLELTKVFRNQVYAYQTNFIANPGIPIRINAALQTQSADSAATCMETDGGSSDTYNAGIVYKRSEGAFRDTCEGDVLWEYSCDLNKNIQRSKVNCPGNGCFDGKCLLSNEKKNPEVLNRCRETDNGKDYSTMSFTFLGTGAWKDDCSAVPNELWEYYCDNNQIKREIHSCPSGCANGACNP